MGVAGMAGKGLTAEGAENAEGWKGLGIHKLKKISAHSASFAVASGNNTKTHTKCTFAFRVRNSAF